MSAVAEQAAPVQQLFAVQGNWDQISKYFGIRMLGWQRIYPANSRAYNRVQCVCANKEEAVWLYNALRNSGAVALRNWLD